MKTYCHAPWVPDELEPLLDVAYNFWWTTDREARWLFDRMSNGLWSLVKQNPVRLLRLLEPEFLKELVKKDEIVRTAHAVRDRMRERLQSGGRFRLDPTRRGENPLTLERQPLAAYFSAEFGLHESLPIYSGGLGVLAGDHVRSTSDLGVPFVGVGLLYRQGYFHQTFSLDNWQNEEFRPHGLHDLPIKLIIQDDGQPVTVTLELPDRLIKAQVWVAQVGRSALLLLDTYLRQNRREDRDITARLYDSDRRTRLMQEIVLGVGGVRALEAVHVEPRRFHMNEGHSAFLVLERAAQAIKRRGVSFGDAVALTRPGNLFTTHTPVPAGHEVFRREAMEPFFLPQLSRLGIDAETFFALGRHPATPRHDEFEMTALALRFSSKVNGVSRLHGEVARDMWRSLWPDRRTEEVPIGHVTNGVHVATWVGDAMDELYERHLGPDWIDDVTDQPRWDRLDDVPSSELWEARNRQKLALLEAARTRVHEQAIARNLDRSIIHQKLARLDPEALTIGFARRFATYKRADLLFRHRDRLARLVNDAKRPIQMIFAGKAHPADDLGKKLIQTIIELSLSPDFLGRLLVIEDYDMELGRLMVQGSDVWLNTPRPPKEASGTSGMKAAMNGALTISTRDGWWAEAASPDVGWTIEGGPESDEQDLDERQALELIELLERKVVPAYFDRAAHGLPETWLKMVRESVKTITPVFNTSRMVREYTESYYLA